MKFWFTLMAFFILISGNSWSNPEMEKQLDDHFRVYLIKNDRRSQGDRVVVSGDKAVVYYWKSLNVRTPDEVICDAYEWLLTGRTTYGRGVKEAFERFPSLNQIDISFYDHAIWNKKRSSPCRNSANSKCCRVSSVSEFDGILSQKNHSTEKT
jgi:hypothetical protein